MKDLPAPGLLEALIAHAQFHQRHRCRDRELTARGERARSTHYRDAVASARKYAKLARAAGWIGSIRAACIRGDHLKIGKAA